MPRDLFFVLLGFMLTVVTYKNVKKRLFSEKESIFWILASFTFTISPLFLDTFDKTSLSLGIKYPPSLLFIALILFLFFLNFRISKQLYIQNEKIKELSQQLAIINKIVVKKNI